MDTPASVLKDTGEKNTHLTCTGFILLSFLCFANNILLTQSLTLVLSVAVSCVRFPHLHCPCASWPIVRITPRVWSEEVAPSASVLQSLGGHAARSWSASTLLTETPTYCSLTSRTGLKLTSHFRYSMRVLMCAHV